MAVLDRQPISPAQTGELLPFLESSLGDLGHIDRVAGRIAADPVLHQTLTNRLGHTDPLILADRVAVTLLQVFQDRFGPGGPSKHAERLLDLMRPLKEPPKSPRMLKWIVGCLRFRHDNTPFIEIGMHCGGLDRKTVAALYAEIRREVAWRWYARFTPRMG
jgi:hypothetical protein